jgi:regulator of protease activity HflC (stomatin/prohibitin superfamily)
MTAPTTPINGAANSEGGTHIIIRSTHRGVRFEDGVVTGVLDPGRHEMPRRRWWQRTDSGPKVEIELVDVRARELTIRGQEILTSDKVALRVSILVQFRVVDPVAALTAVASFEDRIYSDVQLAARRSLAATALEEILTNRTRLSEDILAEVQSAAERYGVSIERADVKDLIFPGNLQEVMNRVLAAERLAEAQLVDARTEAERSRLAAEAQAVVRQTAARAAAEAERLDTEVRAAATVSQAAAEAEALDRLAEAGARFEGRPDLLRLRELEAIGRLALADGARLYIGFDKHATPTERT